ncbi:MAG: ATP-binding protein [Actinomycetia bacterium]|nr:ATP-binding protein [Actinomycetes bacterium]
MKLRDLLLEDECEWLDFKQRFHDNNVKFLHDILCLMNANADRDRYLVFGVADDKTIIGIENDKNKKKSADIQDLLRQSNFNRIPQITLAYEKNENNLEVAILRILNRPDKPFFLTKDKKNGKSVIRAGVVYTRIGNTNIPPKESAPEDHIELMWRERFGIGLPPIRRMFMLLDDPDAWEKMDGDRYLYHRDFPEYKIIEGKELNPNFVEEWSRKFPDPNASSLYVELWYNATILKRSVFVLVDGARYMVPLPKYISKGKWKISRNSIEYKIANIYKQYYPLAKSLPAKGVEIE